jgi:hypothetical protein
MAFTRTVQVAAMIDGSMVDLTAAGYVLQEDPVVITWGGMDEQRHPTPTKCTFLLDNATRYFSPRNPNSPYYGLLGINVPVFVRVLLAQDLFSGTTSSGWGTADPMGIRDTAYAWTAVGTASDFAEAAGSATHLLSAAATNRYTYLADPTYSNIGVYTECTVAVNDVTGGAIEPANILLRGSGSTYYMVRVSISTAEVLTIALHTEAGTVLAAAVTVAGIVDAVSSKTISVRAEAEGEVLRARVWKTGQPEPGSWHVSAETRTYLTAGWAGVRSGLAASNSNTPVTFSYNTIEMYSPQFAGEVAKWPPSRDTSGNVRRVKIEAWDLFQRLRQGQGKLASALRRGITGMTTPAVAYWPGEDGKDATVVASDSPAAPMSVSGSPDFATSEAFDCSDPLIVLSGGALFGTVPLYTPTSGQSQVRMLIAVPAAGDTNGEKITRVAMTGGTTGLWDVLYGTGGTLTLNIYDPAGVSLYTSGAVAYSMDGRAVRMSLELTQNGADIDWALSTLEATATATATTTTGTLAGRTYGRVDWVNVGGDALFTGIAVGHITVQNVVNSIYSLLNELIAYTGEVAEARIRRLAQQEGITVYVGQGATTGQPMGAQRPDTLLNLLEECTESDLGGLTGMVGEVGISYSRLNYAYNQTAALTLDASNHEVTEMVPVDDNFLIRNKIIAQRVGGSEYTATQTTGRLAAADPIDGGVGVYDDNPHVSLSSDAQLPAVAGYRLLQGTVDQPRFPELAVSLANQNVRAKEATTRALIDLWLWKRIQITNPATAADLYDTVDLLSVGLAVVLSKFIHRLTINANPYDPYRIFQIDSATYGRLDLDSTLNEDLDTTETGVDVAVASGPLWTLQASDWPFPIMIGGERMTVTAVTGSSSPQTLTVTRSVNGVVKTHSTGDAVHVADPSYQAGW